MFSAGNYNWCERRDSNSHGLPHWHLKPARLPIPPLSPYKAQFRRQTSAARGYSNSREGGRLEIVVRYDFHYSSPNTPLKTPTRHNLVKLRSRPVRTANQLKNSKNNIAKSRPLVLNSHHHV